ncbi:MAG: hypothetical protein JJ956_16560 [Pseudomonadales bacterium]|nr:hypothetical protein [Pseudomonadales bacterium]
MGAEFVEKAARSFAKSWDKGKVKLSTADLLTRTPEQQVVVCAADLLGPHIPKIGDQVTVELEGSRMIARDGVNEIAIVNQPSAAVQEALKKSCSIAPGQIEKVHSLAGVIEVSIL